MGVTETATLTWFRSYLSGRIQCVHVNNKSAANHPLKYGLPQGSVLGPILFTTYTQPLYMVQADINFMIYADDDQLHFAFEPRSASSTNHAIPTPENCLSRVKAWMTHDFLKLNDAKTQLLVIASPSMTRHLQPIQLEQGYSTITPSRQIQNLGVTWDSTMRYKQHITNLCESACLRVHKIYRIRKFLTDNATKSLVHAFVTSRTDYCKSLLFGTLEHLLDRLQRVLNTAAWLVTGSPRSPQHHTSASRTSLAPCASQDAIQACPTYIQSISWPGSCKYVIDLLNSLHTHQIIQFCWQESAWGTILPPEILRSQILCVCCAINMVYQMKSAVFLVFLCLRLKSYLFRDASKL